ncbi:hypothetical protein DFP72DRAFT_849955 [Ephemerocybe angulata]|uniref:Uncharacterized protein n=1 Tax=Ephemerocybe angulata TaxID=980116 RepID=A0A8H6M5T9_9AGAR|nr:hypothetical protein DFP72DRAFT_849955 [Tulosesus angulatus]
MHFTALRLLSIVASLAVLSKAYSNNALEARDYIDELSTRADASFSSLSTRELIAELSECLDRRKAVYEPPKVCKWCGKTTNSEARLEPCEATEDGKHAFRKRRTPHTERKGRR